MIKCTVEYSLYFGVVGVSLAKVDACRVRPRSKDCRSIESEVHRPNRVYHQSTNPQEEFAAETKGAQFLTPNAIERQQDSKRVVTNTQEAKRVLCCCETLLLVAAQHALVKIKDW